ncbi:MAG: hypothetical protein FJX76_14785 [Armatimonadetes bacterium]|nr:hypothetical protein [Armatimonadota bacterium]
MRKKRPIQHGEENLDRWLLTYSDLITLLLATFVMMYAFSKIKEGNPDSLAINDETVPQVAPSETTFLSEAQKEAEERKFRKLRMKLDKKMRFTPYVKVVNDQRGLVIRLRDKVACESGCANLKPKARQILDALVPIIGDASGNTVRVEGHTDNVPIHTVAYPSNWHLSTSRAISVIFYFINKHHLSAERFLAQGYGDRRSLSSNASEEGRAANRRVDIVIVKRGAEFVQMNRRRPGTEASAVKEEHGQEHGAEPAEKAEKAEPAQKAAPPA